MIQNKLLKIKYKENNNMHFDGKMAVEYKKRQNNKIAKLDAVGNHGGKK